MNINYDQMKIEELLHRKGLLDFHFQTEVKYQLEKK